MEYFFVFVLSWTLILRRVGFLWTAVAPILRNSVKRRHFSDCWFYQVQQQLSTIKNNRELPSCFLLFLLLVELSLVFFFVILYDHQLDLFSSSNIRAAKEVWKSFFLLKQLSFYSKLLLVLFQFTFPLLLKIVAQDIRHSINDMEIFIIVYSTRWVYLQELSMKIFTFNQVLLHYLFISIKSFSSRCRLYANQAGKKTRGIKRLKFDCLKYSDSY